MQVMNSFAVPVLILLLEFIQFFRSLFVQLYRSCQLFCSHSYSYLPHFHFNESYNIPGDLPLSHFFLLWGYTITIDGSV